MEENSYLFVNGIENISKDWSLDNMKRTGLTGYIDDFRVDYDAIAVDDIKDIHK